MQKTNIQKSFWGACGLLGMLTLVVGINYLNTQSQESDPLGKFLSDTYSQEDLGADFITTSLSSYSGPTNPRIELCKESIRIEEPIGKIIASYNIAANITQNIDDIRSEINPIFGHAVHNSEINWIWDTENQEYTFYSALGDEAFWKCYFSEETEFFTEFFISESIIIPGEILYPDTILISLSSDIFITSTSEGNRNISLSQENAVTNGAFLGFITIDSPVNQDYSHSFFNRVDEIPQIIELFSDNNSVIDSTSEVLRNSKFPFITLNISSTREEERIKAVHAVKNISIRKNENPLLELSLGKKSHTTTSYEISLHLNPFVPLGVDYQIEIDPLFLSAIDTSKILFMGSRLGPSVSIINKIK